MYATNTDREIAARLNAKGFRGGCGKPFTQAMVAHLRNRHGLKKYRLQASTPGFAVH